VSDGADWTSAGRLLTVPELWASSSERAIADSDAATGGRREDWRSTSAAGLDVSSADQRRTAAGLTSTEVQCREELGGQ